MTEKLKVADLPDSDMPEMLETDEEVANYLALAVDENDIGEIAHALGVVARARGMSVLTIVSGCARSLERRAAQRAAGWVKKPISRW